MVGCGAVGNGAPTTGAGCRWPVEYRTAKPPSAATTSPSAPRIPAIHATASRLRRSGSGPATYPGSPQRAPPPGRDAGIGGGPSARGGAGGVGGGGSAGGGSAGGGSAGGGSSRGVGERDGSCMAACSRNGGLVRV